MSTRTPLQTREVFLDTEAYRRLGFDTSKPSIKALQEHVLADRLQLHTTDITLSEVERQIAAIAQDAMQEVKRARATLAAWHVRAPKALGKRKLVKPINAEAVAREAFNNFKNGIAPFTQHFASQQEATEIFRAYFRREPPFDGQGGKSVKEFPDAFVISQLQDWCERNNSFMYVVTADKAMLRAAEGKERLIALETLDELLEAATREHDPNVIERVETILEQPDFEDQLSRAIDRSLDDLIVNYMGSLYEGEASEPSRAGDPSIVDWTVISTVDQSYGLIIEFDVDLLVQVHFTDVSMASYDNEDGVYIGAEPGHAEIEEDSIRLKMFIQTHNDCSITRAELLTAEIEAYGPDETYK